MNKLVAGFIAVLFSCGALASDEAAREKMIQNGIKVCQQKGFATVGERDKCVAEFTAKANERYPARGSDSYAKKHYGGMNKAQAEATLIELQKEWQGAAKGGYFGARRTGVVTKKAVAAEGWWIQVNILGVRESQDDPWFMECKGFQTANIVRRCPLGKGGAE